MRILADCNECLLFSKRQKWKAIFMENRLKYGMPRYEVKYSGKNDWEEISDVELMEKLYQFHNRVSPVIKQMIEGKQLQTPDAVYRLKWRGGDSAVI